MLPLLQALCQTERLIPRLLAMRPLMLISTVSYSLFIWHWYGVLLRPLFAGLPAAAELVITVGVTIACAGVAYLVLERPFRRLAASRR